MTLTRATRFVRQVEPKDWRKYYTRKQSNNPSNYAKSAFTCRGAYALCAFATCVKVEGSDPPVAECGCYSYPSKTINLGAIVGLLVGYATARYGSKQTAPAA